MTVCSDHKTKQSGKLGSYVKASLGYAVGGALFGAAAAGVCKMVGANPEFLSTAAQFLGTGTVVAGSAMGAAAMGSLRMASQKAAMAATCVAGAAAKLLVPAGIGALIVYDPSMPFATSIAGAMAGSFSAYVFGPMLADSSPSNSNYPSLGL